MKKWTDYYMGFIAGVVAMAALAYIFWRSQVPPPE